MSKQTICSTADLVKNSGVCALVETGGVEQQIALFYLPDTEKKIFAISNWDPIGNANVMSRGIIGNIGEELVVASPLYKQHFSLTTGKCIEDDASVQTFDVSIEDDNIILNA